MEVKGFETDRRPLRSVQREGFVTRPQGNLHCGTLPRQACLKEPGSPGLLPTAPVQRHRLRSASQIQKTFIHHCILQWHGSLFQAPIMYTLWGGVVLRILECWNLTLEALTGPLHSKGPQ